LLYVLRNRGLLVLALALGRKPCQPVVVVADDDVLPADVQYSLGQAGVGAAGCVMCVVWLATALALGRTHKQLASNTAALKV
jgi:hypothetical protein